ncbi:MAG: tyrosine-type recombinase/integrase [Blautia sp.]|nr:tyrosine-type recombinase/integrase [Blautia sp.]MCM1200964.1 tyrosine-type recombinase/integrase [Bacteroides fragilis]
MGTTKPIRKMEDIKKLECYFREKEEWRNYTLVVIGLNTALRISDILELKWHDVYNFADMKYKEHIVLKEKKTEKETQIKLNCRSIEALDSFRQVIVELTPQLYIFKSSRTHENRPINRYQAYKIINQAGKEIGLDYAISCHSLRKTFGYQAWQQGISPALLMEIYNHSSMEITKRYLSINQDDKDSAFLQVIL